MRQASAVSAPEAAPAAIPAIGQPWPGTEGSSYAGIARGVDGAPDYHLALLADKPDGPLNWKAALAWAESIGAHVPTRDESAHLYAYLRDQFEQRYWHWTATQYSSNDAWYQTFSTGYQDYYGKESEARARAVRRLPLQSFNPLEG